ncbi:MAG: hypothetical protein WCI74_06035, partial [Actinomycetes bacterium]
MILTTYHGPSPAVNEQAANPSRRVFLALAAVGGVAVAVGGGALASAARGAMLGNPDVALPHELGGITPAPHVVGATVVEGSSATHLVFDAAPGPGVAAGSKAVVTLKDVLAWRFRSNGDFLVIRPSVDPSGLAPSSVYEVQDSSWTPSVAQANPRAPLSADSGANLHHYLFTFGATSFECVVGS